MLLQSALLGLVFCIIIEEPLILNYTLEQLKNGLRYSYLRHRRCRGSFLDPLFGKKFKMAIFGLDDPKWPIPKSPFFLLQPWSYSNEMDITIRKSMITYNLIWNVCKWFLARGLRYQLHVGCKNIGFRTKYILLNSFYILNILLMREVTLSATNL